jgi:predicted nucleotidyltransferase
MTEISHQSVMELAHQIAARLGEIEGVIAVVLGGSWARGAGTPASDIDLGIYYDGDNRPSIMQLRALASELDDRHAADLATDYGGWGPWIDGGAWLEIGGQRVDWIYRNFQRIRGFILDCREGRTQMHYQPGHPHGFASYIYMGEVSYCIPLHDPHGQLAELKSRTTSYPTALKTALLNHNLWEAGFALDTCRKSAARGDVYHVTGNLFRCASCLIQALFALNETYWINEKGSLATADAFALSPVNLYQRVTANLANIGTNPTSLSNSVALFDRLLLEIRSLYT